jgi:hypothetical protein
MTSRPSELGRRSLHCSGLDRGNDRLYHLKEHCRRECSLPASFLEMTSSVLSIITIATATPSSDFCFSLPPILPYIAPTTRHITTHTDHQQTSRSRDSLIALLVSLAPAPPPHVSFCSWFPSSSSSSSLSTLDLTAFMYLFS